MKVFSFAFVALYGWGFFQILEAQTPKPSFDEGWYRILNGRKALEVVPKHNEYVVRLAKKNKSSKQYWKLTRLNEDQYVVYYRLTNQSLGDKKALTIFETDEGILLCMNPIDGKDSVKTVTSQSLVIMYVNNKIQKKGEYIILCMTPMSYLTYERGRFILDYHEKTQPNQIWKFEK